MVIEVLDPSFGEDRGLGDRQETGVIGNTATTACAERPRSLAGLTVGIVSNGKFRTAPFFDALEAELRERHGVARTVRVTKPSYNSPAPAEMMDEARRWDALVAGIGD